MLMKRGLIIVYLLGQLTACSLFIAETDEDVVLAAQQLLEAQKDEYGDPKKIDLPVRINYAIDHKPVIGHDLEVEFEFIAERTIPVLRIGVTTSDGLTLESSDIRERYRDVPPRQALTKSVVVVPTEENRFYLNLYVITEVGEEQRARHVKIPIAVGEYSLKKPGRE